MQRNFSFLKQGTRVNLHDVLPIAPFCSSIEKVGTIRAFLFVSITELSYGYIEVKRLHRRVAEVYLSSGMQPVPFLIK